METGAVGAAIDDRPLQFDSACARSRISGLDVFKSLDPPHLWPAATRYSRGFAPAVAVLSRFLSDGMDAHGYAAAACAPVCGQCVGSRSLGPGNYRMAADQTNTRQRILDAAAHLFRERGFHATTTRAISHILGIQPRSPLPSFRTTEH